MSARTGAKLPTPQVVCDSELLGVALGPLGGQEGALVIRVTLVDLPSQVAPDALEPGVRDAGRLGELLEFHARSSVRERTLITFVTTSVVKNSHLSKRRRSGPSWPAALWARPHR